VNFKVGDLVVIPPVFDRPGRCRRGIIKEIYIGETIHGAAVFWLATGTIGTIAAAELRLLKEA